MRNVEASIRVPRREQVWGTAWERVRISLNRSLWNPIAAAVWGIGMTQEVVEKSREAWSTEEAYFSFVVLE